MGQISWIYLKFLRFIWKCNRSPVLLRHCTSWHISGLVFSRHMVMTDWVLVSASRTVYTVQHNFTSCIGLESWEFFVLQYRVKFHDNVVISSRNFTVRSLALPHPVRRLSRPRYLYVSLSFPPLARRLLLRWLGGCSCDGSSWPICSSSSRMAQHFVHLCNWSLSESRYCSATILLWQINATISSCCEVRDDIVGYYHTIRALLM